MYESATKLLEKKEYDQAIEIYKQIIDYKDSRDKITEAEYGIADQLFQEGDNYDAARAFYELGDYKDSWNYTHAFSLYLWLFYCIFNTFFAQNTTVCTAFTVL